MINTWLGNREHCPIAFYCVGQVLNAAMNAEEELSHFTISTRAKGREGGIADLLNESFYTLYIGRNNVTSKGLQSLKYVASTAFQGNWLNLIARVLVSLIFV